MCEIDEGDFWPGDECLNCGRDFDHPTKKSAEEDPPFCCISCWMEFEGRTWKSLYPGENGF